MVHFPHHPRNRVVNIIRVLWPPGPTPKPDTHYKHYQTISISNAEGARPLTARKCASAWPHTLMCFRSVARRPSVHHKFMLPGPVGGRPRGSAAWMGCDRYRSGVFCWCLVHAHARASVRSGGRILVNIISVVWGVVLAHVRAAVII